MEQPVTVAEEDVVETPAARKVLDHLDALGIPYERMEHVPVRTSEEAAAVRGTRLEQGAKALILKADGGYHCLVLSAALKVDNARVRRILGTRKVRFATPEEVGDLTGCLPGAVPPFGNLFGLPVLVDEGLLREETVNFNCGSRRLSLGMRRADMVRAAEATVAAFAAAE